MIKDAIDAIRANYIDVSTKEAIGEALAAACLAILLLAIVVLIPLATPLPVHPL